MPLSIPSVRRSSRFRVSGTGIFVLCLLLYARTLSVCGADEWCAKIARTPTVCSEEGRKLEAQPWEGHTPHLVLDDLPMADALQQLGQSIAEEGPGKSSSALYLLRGRILGSHGLLTEALCDLQLAASRGVSEAASEASAMLLRVERAEKDNFTALDTLQRLCASALTAPASRYRLRRLLNEWRFEHVHHSTAIDGNPLSYASVRALLETRLIPEGYSGPIDVLLQVMGSDDALDFLVKSTGFGEGNNTKAAAPVSEELLLNIYGRVVPFSFPEVGDRSWRKVGVQVADHIAPAATEVQRLMRQLFSHWNSQEFIAMHPVEQAALAHFEFLWVLPFERGNGLTARLLSSYFLMRAGFPPLNVLLSDRPLYYDALKRSHPRNVGCTRALVHLFREIVQRQTEELAGSLIPMWRTSSRENVSGLGVDASGAVPAP
jgi:Fic/DOC family